MTKSKQIKTNDSESVGNTREREAIDTTKERNNNKENNRNV